MSKIKNLLSLILYAFLLNCSFGVGGGWNDLSEELEPAKTRKNAKIIFKLLLQHKINNRTIIFATHNRYFANMADCKIELIDGKMKIINGRIN